MKDDQKVIAEVQRGAQHYICFDCGDTLVDESSEVKDSTGVTLRAALIPGAADVVRLFKNGENVATLEISDPFQTLARADMPRFYN